MQVNNKVIQLNKMKSIIITLLIFSFVNLYSQDRINSEPKEQIIIADIVAFLPALVTTIGFHEFGHYAVAKAVGAKNASFGLFRKKPNGGFQLGWTHVYDTLSSFKTSMVDIGGVIFSRGMSEIMNIAVNSKVFPKSINIFFSITYLMERIDFPRYVIQDALLNMGDKKGSDIDDFVTAIAGHRTSKRTITYLSLIALSVVDLVLDWNTISKYWSIITGQPYTESHEVSKVKFRFNAFAGSAFNLSVFINL